MKKADLKMLLWEIWLRASRHERACDNVKYLRGDMEAIELLVAKWRAIKPNPIRRFEGK